LKPRSCVAADCDSGKGCSHHKFPPDELIRKKWTKADKQQRKHWDGPSDSTLLCLKHFTEDCFEMDGSHYQEKLMGLPAPKRLKCDAVSTIFPRSINYVEDMALPAAKVCSI